MGLKFVHGGGLVLSCDLCGYNVRKLYRLPSDGVKTWVCDLCRAKLDCASKITGGLSK